MSFRFLAVAATVSFVFGASAACAAGHTQVIDTSSVAYGYWTDTGGAGPYPFSNFGVQASDSVGTSISASVYGSTSFTFPTFAAGASFRANTDQIDYAYTPTWNNNGGVGSHTGVSANASFNYDIGPFSGSKTLYDTALNASSSAGITGGTSLTGSSGTSGTVVGPTAGLDYGLSAYFASASVGLHAGLNIGNSVSVTPTVQYGYYTWINTTGGFTGADTAVWHGVTGGDLTYGFTDNLEAQAGSEDFYLNFLPGVQLVMPISATATITIPLDGNFHAEAFGDTLVDYNLTLANLYSDSKTYNWEDDVDWAGTGYYSLHLQEDNSLCQYEPGPSCEFYNLITDPGLLTQTLISPNTTSDYNGTSTGGWNPVLGNAPLLPDACDPTTGICYRSNDPNMPIGPGTVTTTVTAGIPEPGAWTMMLIGFAGLGAVMRRRRLTAATN